LDFEYGAGTAVTDGCGAYLHNEFWYFGGNAGGNTAATRDLRQVKFHKHVLNVHLFYFRQVKLLDASWSVNTI